MSELEKLKIQVEQQKEIIRQLKDLVGAMADELESFREGLKNEKN